MAGTVTVFALVSGVLSVTLQHLISICRMNIPFKRLPKIITELLQVAKMLQLLCGENFIKGF